MTLPEGLIMGCQDEELSEAQINQYDKALKEYEKAMAEANQLKKEGSQVSRVGNTWLIKTTCNVKIRNTSQAGATNAGLSKALQTTSSLNQPTTNSLLRTLPPNTQILKAVPIQQLQTANISAPSIPTTSEPPGLESIPVSSPQLLSHLMINKPKPAQVVQVVQPTFQAIQTAVNKPMPPALNKLPATRLPPGQTGTSLVTNRPQEPPKKSTSTPTAPDDPKLLAKTIPSLCVVVKPSKLASDAVNQKKREVLDSFVKSRLVMDSRRFAEWLMQVGLLRSQQFGICRIHSPQVIGQMQLRMYAEESRFPHSGGYVWITKCCDRNFVSIFRESVFEESGHPPSVLLKLMYHWACQTTISNVVQWVKVDHLYLRTFYTMLRAVCTVEIHSSTPVFGTSSKNCRVEVGVISLGTTSTDGKRRDVKVEVLGVYDQETQKIRLRASEPLVGDTRSRSRFAKILEPLTSWVSKAAVILTDYTVDRTALEELGYNQVVQKTLNTASAEDQLSNRTIMDYLRRTVPKVFQNTLSVLSTAAIQQFLDELVWRETNGQTSSDAFHNVVRDLGIQARAETGLPLVKRLQMVATDPFKDWSLPLVVSTPAAAAAESQPQVVHAPIALVPTAPSGGVKRPAVNVAGPSSNPKEPKISPLSSYYATMYVARADPVDNDQQEEKILCQRSGCKKLINTNLDMMSHLRAHITSENGSADVEQCTYCLESFPSLAAKRQHEENAHLLMISFKMGTGREDSSVIKGVVCLICHEKFEHYRQLELHLEKLHVSCEMPYRCRVCYFQSSVHSQLVDHFHETHPNGSHLLCPLCLDTFSTKGDNAAENMDTGHMQYMDHLKSHLSMPVVNLHRCKRCVLSFLQYEQLRYHIRTDHISTITNPAARPFTFTISKLFTPKPTPPAKVVLSPSAAALAKASLQPKVVSVAPASPASVASTSSAASSKASSSKTSAKDALLELQNTTVARRFTGLHIWLDPSAPTSQCFECGGPMKAKGHFAGYLCCNLCRFSTCCVAAMKKHHDGVHKADAPPVIGSVFELKPKVVCKCGFTCKYGLDLERHLMGCDYKSVTVAQE